MVPNTAARHSHSRSSPPCRMPAAATAPISHATVTTHASTALDQDCRARAERRRVQCQWLDQFAVPPTGEVGLVVSWLSYVVMCVPGAPAQVSRRHRMERRLRVVECRYLVVFKSVFE